jgi:hypothetical protein
MHFLDYGLRRARNLYKKTYTLLVRHRFQAVKTYLDPRVEITNPQFVNIGYGVTIRPFSWIYAISDDRELNDVFIPSIETR